MPVKELGLNLEDSAEPWQGLSRVGYGQSPFAKMASHRRWLGKRGQKGERSRRRLPTTVVRGAGPLALDLLSDGEHPMGPQPGRSKTPAPTSWGWGSWAFIREPEQRRDPPRGRGEERRGPQEVWGRPSPMLQCPGSAIVTG